MRLRSTLFLALLFAALAGYLYFVELQRETNGDAATAAVSFDKAAVTRIELEHPGRVVILQREEGVWEMIEPVRAPADERAVANLLDTVRECQISRTLEDAGELAGYGLDVPSATVRLQTGADEFAEINVGKKTPVGSSAYIQRNDDAAVHLTDASFVTRIDLDATALRDKTILDFHVEDVERLRIHGSRGEVSLEKSGGAWRIAAPSPYDADGVNVGNFLSTLQSMRATEFFDDVGERLAHFGLVEPQLTVALGLAGGEDLDLRVGNEREGKLRLQTSSGPTVFAVAAWLRDSLDREVNHFRDKTISLFIAEDAARIEIDPVGEGEPPFALERTDDGWSLDGQRARTSIADEMLRDLSNLTGFEIAAEDPEDLSALGLDPPRRSLRVRDRQGAELAAVHIGSHVADGAETEYTVVAEGSSTILHLREFVFQRLATTRADLIEDGSASEGSAAPIPDGDAGDGVDEDSLDDAAAAGEER